VQRIADLRDLAGARRQGLDVELAARDALGVGGEARQRAQDPAAQEHDDHDQRGGERDEPRAERDRPARRGALARDPQEARDVRLGDRDLVVAAELALEVAALDRRREQLGLGGEGELRLLGIDPRLGVETPVRGGDRRPELRFDAEGRQLLHERGTRGRVADVDVAQNGERLRLAAVGAGGLPAARRRPPGNARQRGHGDHEGQRQRQPHVQRQRAPRHRAAGGSKR
jgi:hypothetical protein